MPIGSQALLAPENILVPAADSADNIDIADVIGTKLDTYDGDSLYALLLKAAAFVSRERLVYPTLAAGATVVSAAADWTHGAYATIVPASTITNKFFIAALSIESCDKNATLELQLYQGAGDDVVTTVRFNITGGFFGNQVHVVGSAEIPANARIRARLASSDGLANQATITMSIIYWEFA